ncbi:MAG TPA: LCP family protein [Candidatus Baltobacteraceae bacterium]|nr:LCP family protein [Candidatus Baltobacteraceae bacterium]
MDKQVDPHEEERTTSGLDMRRAAIVIGSLVVLGIVALVAGFSVAFHRTPMQVLSLQLTPSPQELFGKDHILVLVEGLDYDYNDKDEEYSTQSRSDIIKAVDLDFRTHKIYVLAVPRDMQATLPNGEIAKINQAQSDGGVREAQSVISKWLGIPGFDRYVLLRINTTKDLINAIGGVNVYVKTSDCLTSHTGCTGGRIDYDDTWGHLHIHFAEGIQHMNGDQAVAYARFRHDWCSDPCRIMRQSQVMQAALDKIKSNKLNTLMHAGDLIGVFRRDVDSNLTQPELLALANSFIDMPKNGLVTNQVPFADENLGIPDQVAKAQLVQSMLVNPPVPTPTPNAAAIAAINPLSVRVDVENGTTIPGVARRVATLLKQKGFTIGTVGNASSDDVATTQLHEHTKIAFAGMRVRVALGKAAANAQVISDAESPTPDATATPSDVTVIVGQDIASGITQQASTQP